MRVYEKQDSKNVNYLDDMKRILDYLNEHGTLLVKPLTVEKLYHDFSKDRYAVWLYVDDDVLEEFANWLDELDI